MIVYSVKVKIKKTIEPIWLDWMLSHHIKDVLNTGYFSDCKVFKQLSPESIPDEIVYVFEYHSESLNNYELYIEKESGRLQQDHKNKFDGYFSAERSVREQIL